MNGKKSITVENTISEIVRDEIIVNTDIRKEIVTNEIGDIYLTQAWKKITYLGWVGLLGVFIYSLSAEICGPDHTSCQFFKFFGLLLATAGGSFTFGGLLGFLFGIPRSAQDPKRDFTPDSQNEQEQRFQNRYKTHLEEISDWLTKIVIGVGLTQLTTIPHTLWHYSGRIANYSNYDTLQTFVAGSIVYFGIIGFFYMYFFARCRLLRMMRLADEEDRAKKILKDKVLKQLPPEESRPAGPSTPTPSGPTGPSTPTNPTVTTNPSTPTSSIGETGPSTPRSSTGPTGPSLFTSYPTPVNAPILAGPYTSGLSGGYPGNPSLIYSGTPGPIYSGTPALNYPGNLGYPFPTGPSGPSGFSGFAHTVKELRESGIQLIADGNFDMAIGILKRAHTLDSTDVEVKFLLGRAYAGAAEESGKDKASYMRAATQFFKSIVKAPTAPQSTSRWLGFTALWNNDTIDDAITAGEDWSRINKDDPGAMLNLACAYAQKLDLDKTNLWVTKVLARSPDWLNYIKELEDFKELEWIASESKFVKKTNPTKNEVNSEDKKPEQ